MTDKDSTQHARPSWTPEEMSMVTKAMHEATGSIDRTVGALEPDARELGVRGWTVPVDQLPALVLYVVRTLSPEETDSFFLRLYEENNRHTFQELGSGLRRKPALTRWRALLEQCIQAYERGHHLVAIPSLLAVYEGVLARVVDRFTESTPRRLAEDELGQATRGLERVLWASIDSFTSSLFQSRAFSGERPATLNRHWVLHGRDETEWKQVDALRLFQAIHSVASATLLHKRDMRQLFRDKVLYDMLIAMESESNRR